MLIFEQLSKEILEEHIFKNLLEFGKLYTTNLLDSVKQLGFSFATSGGISIGIDDLKTYRLKNQKLDSLKNFEIKITKNTLSYSILKKIAKMSDEMHAAIKTAVKAIYMDYDPLNNLHLMSSSGARGSFTQVCQLVGLRGNMSDAHGNKIAIPVEANFREGLTVLEYFISAFGARKGVIDTALGTASSGYLTRRLIFAMRELIVREIDCGKNHGLIFYKDVENQENDISSGIDIQIFNENIKYLADIFTGKINLSKDISNSSVESSHLNKIATIYSPLTCNSLTSICQKCYNQHIVPLGNPIGIIAAQSIGEPATQMTMRTFHTGGIFAGELQQDNSTKFSGQILYKEASGPIYKICISHLNQKFFENNNEIWNSITNIKIPKNFFFKTSNEKFFIEKEFDSLENGEIMRFKFLEFKGLRSKTSGKFSLRTIKPCNKNFLDKQVEIEPGFHVVLPKNISFSANFLKKKAGYLAFLNIRAADTQNLETLSLIKKQFFEINALKKFAIPEKILKKNLKQIYLKLVYKGQHVDENTILSRVYLHSKRKNNIKNFEYISKHSIFFEPFANNFCQESIDGNLKMVKHLSEYYQISPNSKIISSANFSARKPCSYKSISVFKIPRDIIFLKNFANKSFVYSGQIFAKVKEKKITGADIVQGLPKINRIIEANLHEGCLAITKFSGLVFLRDISKKDLNVIGQCLAQKNEYLITIFCKEFVDLHLKCDAEEILKTEIISFTKTSINFLKGNKKKTSLNVMLKPYTYFFKNSPENTIRFMQICASRTAENINMHTLCEVLAKHFQYRLLARRGAYFCIYKLRIILVQSLVELYGKQGIKLHSKHFEILVKQLTEKVLILNGGQTPFLPTEKISVNIASEFCIKKLEKQNSLYFRPIICSAKTTAISSKSFLSNISFQEIKRGLMSAVMSSNNDWIMGLKESIILGRDLPIGNNFALKKKNLDNFLIYKYRKNHPKF